MVTQASTAAGAVFRKYMLRAEAVIASVFLTAMVMAILIQVIARFFFSIGLSWTDEVAAFSFVWAALLGAAITVETRSMHLVDAFVRPLPHPVRRLIALMVYAFMLGTLGVLIVSGLEIVEVVNRQHSSVLGLPMSYVYAAMPACALLMAISLLLDWRLYLGVPANGERTHG